MPNPVQPVLTVVQSKVLVKSTQHRCQIRLLDPAWQVHVFLEPFMGVIQKLPAAVVRRNAHHSEFALPIHPTHMLEPEKLERAESLAACGGALSGKPTKPQQASRVAQWRASQVTVKEPDYVSTEPPIIRTAGFPRSGWKSRYSASAFPVPPEPNSGRRLVCARLP